MSEESFANATIFKDTLKYWTIMSPDSKLNLVLFVCTNIMTSNEVNLAEGRGFIQVKPSDRIGLAPPYTSNLVLKGDEHMQEIYMVSVFHQLHCLVSLILINANE